MKKKPTKRTRPNPDVLQNYLVELRKLQFEPREETKVPIRDLYRAVRWAVAEEEYSKARDKAQEVQKQIARLQSKHGGDAEKEAKGILKAIKMILPSAEKKDAYSLLNYFVNHHKGIDLALNVPMTKGVCKVFSMIGKDKTGMQRAMIFEIRGDSSDELDDTTLHGVKLPTFRRYVRKAKKNYQ